MKPKKPLITLGSDGELVLKSPDGKVRKLASPDMQVGQAFVYLVIDCSTSMAGNKLEQAKRGSLDFAQSALGRGYEVGLIAFSDDSSHLCPPVIDLTKLRVAVNRLRASGGTDLTPAIGGVIRQLGEKNNALRAMVVVTDGATVNPHSALKAADKAKAMGISILAIGTDDADFDFLSKLASDTDLATKVSNNELEETISTATKMLPKWE